MPEGFYWVRFANETEITIDYNDGDGKYPWQVIGSDEIFQAHEIIMLCAIAGL